MKLRLTTLMLTVTLLIAWVLPVCASNYYEDLWGKFDLQVESGSGFKATLTGESQGESLLSGLDMSLNGLSGEVSLIRDQKTPEVFQFVLNLAKAGTPLDQVMVFGDDKAAAISADFLKETVKLPLADLKDLVQPANKDYEWINILYNWATCEDEIWLAQLATAGESYLLDLEMWLANYAQVSSDVVDGAMTISYVIPAADLKAEMQRLLVQLMSDEDMLAVLGQLLTADQAYRYLNPQWTSQYASILSGITLEGQVEVVHTQSMKGELLSTRVVMPIPAHLGLNYETFTVESDEDHWYFGLTGQESLSLRWDKQTEGNLSNASGLLSVNTSDLKVEAEFAFKHEKKTWKDEENYENLTNQWTLTASNPKAGETEYLAFEPLTLTYADTLRSGPDRRNSTHVDMKATLVSGEGTDTLHLTGKTSSPWAMSKMDLEAAASIIEMDEGQQLELVASLLSALGSWVAK